MIEPLFVSHGDTFVSTEHTRGPWDPRFQHGGPTAALLARQIEAIPSDSPMEVARLTIEIMRPVPIAPLRVATKVMRPGKKVRVIDAVITAGDEEIISARALQIRCDKVDVPNVPSSTPPPLDGAVKPSAIIGSDTAFHSTGMDIRFVVGHFDEAGPATAWFRLARSVIDDEPPSPLQRIAAAADFCNGISMVLDWRRYIFINPDLDIHVVRYPVGEWVCLDAHTTLGTDGRGLAHGDMYDESGYVGDALQSLFLECRTGS